MSDHGVVDFQKQPELIAVASSMPLGGMNSFEVDRVFHRNRDLPCDLIECLSSLLVKSVFSPTSQLNCAERFSMCDERRATAEAFSGTVVNRFDVPFSHLVAFFIKAVFAAIPALIVLSVLLYLGGNVLKAMYPELIHMQILVTFPN